jgi:hypothetical protein
MWCFSRFSGPEKPPINTPMAEWVFNNHAEYTLAAYAVAALALIGIGLVSICAHRRTKKELQKLSGPKI